LLFVGDIMLSRAVGARMQATNDWGYPFRKIADTLRAADLAIGNLECPVSEGGKNQYHLYSFRADPKTPAGLNEAGFGVVSLANNHMYDWGAPALLDTVRRVREAGVRTVGAGQNDLEAHYPLVVDLAGVRLAFLAYVDVEPKNAAAGPDRPGVAWLDAERVLADIRFARSLADVLVVLPHWGIEYAKLPSRSQVALAHQMIDAGADLVIGGHPHVIQPV
jgi:poly-gamma-glutamate capsule biosynthesis protein CapA/YwtB (metallophosphatase superfamily)